MLTSAPEQGQAELRRLPGVDQLLSMPQGGVLMATFGRGLTLEAIRAVLERARTSLRRGELAVAPESATLLLEAEAWLGELLDPTMRPVINATGVIVHTNLGRAPLSSAALASVSGAGAGYSTLEFNLVAGKRGSRSVHAEKLLKQILKTESALVVNNNAAAVLLMLTALCPGREVIISRGQLVEIGGGFRVPEVMAQSGAQLVEVGTTNRTHLRDYEAAINTATAAILVAHHSNFRIIGFTSEPTLPELATLAHDHDLPLLYDQGSGALLDATPYGLDPEPTVPEGLAAGADVVAFSGDKLLGGPQAGILCGRADLLQEIRKHPLARAVRADKLCLAALSATLEHYLRDEAVQQVPVWQMIARSLDSIAEEASLWAEELAEIGVPAMVVGGHSTVGGGSLPGATLPTKLVALESRDAEKLAGALRQSAVPVVGRIQEDLVLLDPRTVLPGQAPLVLSAIKEATGS